MCYSDVEALYYSEGLNQGKVPYADQKVEYPVLIGAFMAVAAEIVRVYPAADRPAGFFDVTALLLALCALVVVGTTVRLAGGRRGWDSLMVAAAPVLLLHAFTNWDLLAVALTGAGMYAFSRGRPGWAGVALGLGVAAKLYPLLLLVLVFPPLAIRARQERPRDARGPWSREPAVVTFGGAALAWVVVNVPIWWAYPSAWAEFYSRNFHRVADWDSIWYALQAAVGHQFTSTGLTSTLTLAVGITVVVLLAGVLVAVFAAPAQPRVAQVAFLVVLALLLGNKVWSPQYSLWLLPLVVLARPRWGLFLIWQASEIWLLFTRFYFFVGIDKPGQGLGGALRPIFLYSVLARDAVLVTIAGYVLWEMFHPDQDVVRVAEGRDPAAALAY
jgi:uncharacterized membrane protein